MSLSDTAREKLGTVSVATICTALYKRGLANEFIQDVHPVGRTRRMVGPAFTLRYIPAGENLNPISVFQDPAHLADEIVDEAVEMTAFEDFVTEEVQKGCSIIGLYPATQEKTREDFAAWRKARGR